MTQSQLALLGGPRAVPPEITAEMAEWLKWPRIPEETVQRCAEMIRRGEVSVRVYDPDGIMPQFEREYAAFIGRKHCLLQNNGTSTLFSAFSVLGVKGRDDEVIVPAHNWCAAVTTIHSAGGTPIFCDIQPDTLTMDPDDVERKITRNTRAICVVHMWGNPCDMDRLVAISKKHGIPIVEDCSHAHGCEYKGRMIGSFGEIACFSLQGSKPLPGGELGAILVDDEVLYNEILILGHQGRIHECATIDEYRGYSGGLGFKFRAHPVAVRIAYDMFHILDETNSYRHWTVAYLNKELAGIDHVRTIRQMPNTKRFCYEYVLLYDYEATGVDTPKISEALRAEGIDLAVMRYPNMNTVPPFHRCKIETPVSERLHPMMLQCWPFTGPSEERIAFYAKMFGQAVHKVIENIDDLK